MTTSIGDALFTKAQQRVLGLFFGRPDKGFYVNEVVRFAAMGKGVISRELAKGAGHAGSDVDVMLVGSELGYSDIMRLLEGAETQLQRSVNPTIYTPSEFAERLADGQSFVAKVMARPRLDLLQSDV